MKTIEELANEFVERTTPDSPLEILKLSKEIAKSAFIAGFLTAQEWISVKDELPEDDIEVMCKIHSNNDENGTEYTVASYSDELGFWITEFYIYNTNIDYRPTHWRPIERK